MKLYAIILLSLVLVFAACKNQQAGDNTEAASDTQTQANTQTQTNTKAAAQQTASSSSGATSEFKSLFSGRKSIQWQVTYDLSSNSGGQQFNAVMTQYLKGINKIRTDMTVQGTESRSYLVDSTLTSCTNNDGWNCYKMELKKDALAKFEDEVETSQKYKIEADGTKVVAGVTAKCYKVTDTDDSVTVKYCFSSEGVPLYVYFQSPQAMTEMTARSYTKTVSDSVFDLPAGASTSTMPSVPSGSSGASNDPCAYCNYMSGADKDSCLQSCGN